MGLNSLNDVALGKSLDSLSKVNFREKHVVGSLMEPITYCSNSSISLDSNQEYNLYAFDSFNGKTGAIFDGDIKIIEWYQDHQGRLVLESFTKYQLNIFSDIKLKECLIKSLGPLFIKGKMQVSDTIAVSADSLLVAEEMECKGKIVLNVNNELTLASKITAATILLEAQHIYQDEELQAKSQLDIAAYTFSQSSKAVTRANSLRLISPWAMLDGMLEITGSLCIIADSLKMGNDDQNAFFKLSGESYIHVIQIQVAQNTQLTITSDHKPNFIHVEQDFFVSEASITQLTNTKIFVQNIYVNGELNVSNCILDVELINQRGIFSASSSQLSITDSLEQFEDSKTHLANNTIRCKFFNATGGALTIQESHVNGEDCIIRSTVLNLQNSLVHLENRMILGKDSDSTIVETDIITQGDFKASGKVIIVKSSIETALLHMSQNKMQVSDTSIFSNSYLSFYNGAIIKNTSLTAVNQINLNEELILYKTNTICSVLEIKTNTADINGLNSDSGTFQVKGSLNADALVFDNCKIVTKEYDFVKHVTLKNSRISGFNKLARSNELSSNVKFINSTLWSNDEISLQPSGNVTLDNTSIIGCGALRSQGEIKTTGGLIFCASLDQNKAKLDFDLNSKMYVAERFTSKDSLIVFSNQSKLITRQIILGNGDNAILSGDSAFIASEQIDTASDATIEITHSAMITPQLVSFGRMALSSAMLCAEEVEIYGQFDLLGHSQISISELLTVAKNAIMTLDESVVNAGTIDIDGSFNANSTLITVQADLAVKKQGSVQLKNNTLIKAKNMMVDGALIIGEHHDNNQPVDSESVNSETKSTEIILTPSTNSTAVLQIENAFTVSEHATVTGDQNLVLDAKEVTVSGEVKLKSLRAKGELFLNYGSVEADNLFLGFDHGVLNLGGQFYGDNITIHSNFINTLGYVSAKKSLNSAAFFNLNLGLISANNYTNSAILSFNGGIVLPNYSAGLDHIFSVDNLLSAAKTVATMSLPGYSNLINLGFMIPGLMNTGTSLYNSFSQLNWDQFKTMRAHEWMPLVAQVKNTVMSGWNALDTAYSAPGEFSSLGADLSTLTEKVFDINNYTWDKAQSVASAINWIRVGTRAATVFAGNYSDTSLLSVNMGVSLAGSTAKTNLIEVNTGIEGSLLSHSVNTRFFYNSGYVGGTEATFLATNIHNAGNLIGLNQFTLKADHLENSATGDVWGNNANISLESMAQNGRLILNNGQMQVGQFKDSRTAVTELSSMLVQGDDAMFSGQLDANNTHFNFKNTFEATKTSIAKTNNVTIKAGKFTEQGTLNYENSLYVEAEEITLADDSTVIGAKTPEQELFVVKEKAASAGASNTTPLETIPSDTAKADSSTPAKDGAQATDESAKSKNTPPLETTPAEPEKEFKPKHVFIMQSKKVHLDGALSGGDYTKVEGIKIEQLAGDPAADNPSKAELVEIGDHAQIDLSYGSIASQKFNVLGTGVGTLKNFDLSVNATQIAHDAQLTLQKTAMTGDKLISEGTLKLDGDVLKIKDIHLAQDAKETVENTAIYSTSLTDLSDLDYKGQVYISTDHYEHGGTVTKMNVPEGTENTNLFYVKTKDADLHGSADMDKAYFNVEHFKDAALFVEGQGQYQGYKTSDSLMFETEEKLNLNKKINRECDLTVKGASITLDTEFKQKERDLTLISTVGDVTLSQDVTGANVYVDSAGKIVENHKVYAEHAISFTAKEGFYNRGGTLNGDVVAVKASNIVNVSKASAAAKQNGLLPMGDAGVINGRSDTYLEATEGNIENHGGVIRGGKYTQLIAKGNVINNCNVRTTQGAYDVIQDFDGGLIAGGAGTNTDGVGLYIKADGKVISDASDFISNGINYIEADKGFDLKARQHNYVSLVYTEKKGWGRKETHVCTATNIKGTVIQSAVGRNILRTEHGEVKSVATRFSSPGGTDIYAQGDVKLYSLKSESTDYTFKSDLWGLSHSTRFEMHQEATPTLFVDNGVTRITSTQGTVDARGAYFVGAGDLEIRANKRIQFGLDTLNHEVMEKSRSLDVSAPGLAAYGALHNHDKLWDVCTAEDATLAKLNSMIQSDNMEETLANSANLGVNLYNTTNSAMRGLATGTLGKEALARYGLGGAEGFSPAVTLTMTETKTHAQYQTLSEGGVDRGGNVILEAGEGIDLENGVRVHAGGSMDVSAPEIIASAAKLNSREEQESFSLGIGLSVTGVQDASAGYAKSSSQTTNYVNAELSAGGNMKLHNQDKAMSTVVLDGANILAGTLDADIDHLVINDKQDTKTSKTESIKLSAMGQMSGSIGSSTARITTKTSGIHVTEGINNNGHKVHVGDAIMTGGAITSNGKNDIVIDHLETHQLHDEQHSKSIGLNLNINDLGRLAGQKAANTVGEQAIAVGEVSLDKVNYESIQTSVVHGEQGTNAEIGTLDGALHTSSADGRTVIKDEEYHIHLDVPITNSDYIATSTSNMKSGYAKIAEALGLSGTEKKNGHITPQEPAILARNEEEEEEEEELNEKNAEEPNPDPAAEKIADDECKDTNKPSQEELATIDDMQKITEAFLEKNKDHLPPDVLAKLQHYVNESKTGVQQSEERLKTLNEALTSALVNIYKSASAESWEQFAKTLNLHNPKNLDRWADTVASGKIHVDSHFGKYGLVFNITFNILGSALENPNSKEILQKGIAATVSDITIGFALKKTIGAAAGGVVGWSLVALEIADDLRYDEVHQVRGLQIARENSAYGNDLKKKGDFLGAIGVNYAANLLKQDLAQSQGMHELAHLVGKLPDAIMDVYHKIIPPKKDPETPKRNQFFQSKPSAEDKQGAEDLNREEQAYEK